MPNRRIDQLDPNLDPLTGLELIPIFDKTTNTTERVTLNSIAAFVDSTSDTFLVDAEYDALTDSLTLISNNAPSVSVTIPRYNRWYIPFGQTYTVQSNFQSFVYGNFIVEGTLNLEENAQLVVINGDIILSGGTIIGSGTTYSITLPEFNTFVTNGVLNPITKKITFTGNFGFTPFDVDVSGIYNSDRFTTGGTYNNTTKLITFLRNDGTSGYTVDLSSIDTNDTYVTGGTNNGSSITTNNATIDLLYNQDIPSGTYSLPYNDTFTTGGTYFNGELKLTQNSGNSLIITGFTDSLYSAGPIMGATGWSSNGAGQINLPSVKVSLFNNPNNIEPTQVYDVVSGTTGTGGIPSLINFDTNYIVIEYNGGSPIYNVYNNDGPVNDSDVILMYIVYRLNNFIHVLEFGNYGAGLPNKLNDRFMMTDRFGWETGVSLGLSGTTGVVTLTSGVVWDASYRQSLAGVNSQDDIFFKNYHVGGNWVYTTTGDTLNNQYYDDGTNLVLATPGKYLVNWYFRGQETNDHLYEVYGNTEYDNIADAQLAVEPILPELVSSHAFLTGRIILEVGQNTGITQSAFVRVFQSTQITTHNDLLGLQGGGPGEYYHLTSNEYNNLVLTNVDNNFSVTQTFNDGIVVNSLTATTIGDPNLCVDDLYVLNIHSCSPITIHDSVQSVTSSGTGANSLAFGYNVLSSGIYSHAEGTLTTASGYYSHAEGVVTKAIGSGSHSEGRLTTASGNYSHSEGEMTIASGNHSHAEGRQTTSTGNYSHTEGLSTISLVDYSHAEGSYTVAQGQYSHAEGSQTTSSGYGSHAEGRSTTSSGFYSHAEGYNTKALGGYSHSEGSFTTSTGDYSHAEGNGTIALADYQHVTGLWNSTNNAQGSFIVGNGIDNLNRSNLLFVGGNNVIVSGKTTTTNLRVTNGANTNYVLTSDAIGNALWSPLPTVTLTSAGGTVSLVNDGTGPTLANKGLTSGTGISLTDGGTQVTITNTAPDQTVVLNNGTGISTSGTYPNFTITNTSPASSVTLTSAGGTVSLVNDGTGPTLTTKGLVAGTGISLTDSATQVTVTNSSPDQIVSLTAGGGISITGAYPNFTITNSGVITNTNTIQLALNEAFITVIGGITTASLTTAFLPFLAINEVGGGGGGTANNRWQFNVPNGYTSNGTINIRTRRATAGVTGTISIYVDGVLSNINGTQSITPVALNTWELFTFTLTTPVTVGQTITVLAALTLANGATAYIRDVYFNY